MIYLHLSNFEIYLCLNKGGCTILIKAMDDNRSKEFLCCPNHPFLAFYQVLIYS